MRRSPRRWEAGARVGAGDANPIDAVWRDRPEPPLAPVASSPTELAGKPASEKIAEIAKVIAEKRADAAVLTDPASIAWLFNIRGGDVPHTPFAALLRDPERGRAGRSCSSTAASSRTPSATGSKAYADVREAHEFCCAAFTRSGREERKVLYDANGSAAAIARLSRRPAARSSRAADPVALPKAKKNAAEIAGSRAAHVRDGVAMLRFLRFIETSAGGQR